jgi:nucleoside-triphosphatase
MNLVVTGRPGIGKTTLIQNVIKGHDNISGFFTQEIKRGRKRVGFAIKTMDGKTGILAHTDIESPYRVSRYKVNMTDIEKVLLPSIQVNTALIVIDEIGKMELFSEQFRQKVIEAFHTGKVIATIMEQPHPFTDALKARKDVHVFTVTEENRDELVNTLRKELTMRSCEKP